MKDYFDDKVEVACSHCGEVHYDPEFRKIMNQLREACGFPLPITSWYRCPEHPIEKAKAKPGAHTTGKAVDIRVQGEQAIRVLELAIQFGFKRIGVAQKSGYGRFIHLDMCDDLPSPALWSY